MSLRPMSPAPRRGEFITRRLNGGLNYSFEFGLTSSELRDCGDVDLSPSGAICSRRALTPFTTCDLGQRVVGSWVWQDILGHDHIFAVMANGEIRVATDGAACFSVSVFGTMVDANSRCTPHAWSAGGWLYVSDGYKVWRWGGTGFPTYNVVTSVLVHGTGDDTVTNLGVPPNCAATVYRDTVFIADTLVYMTDPDALWWSAPVAEQPSLGGTIAGQEDYYINRRITYISGPQSDRLNRLVAAGPTLYAFKRHSVHVLATNGDTVLTNDLASNVGLAGPNAYAVHSQSVWFFDEHDGLHLIEGSSLPVKVFDPIWPLLDCKEIIHPELIAVGHDGNKVFVSCCTDGAAQNNTTFVLDTSLQSTTRGGAWTRWEIGFSSFVRWQPQAGDSSLVGFTTNERGGVYGAVRLNECSDAIVDNYGFATREFHPWFTTAFFDDGLPTLTKRFGRVALTVSGSDRVVLDVAAYAGAKPSTSTRCELPARNQPSLKAGGNGTIDVDLTERLCDDPTSTPLCDTDSRGVSYDNGVVFCGTATGDGPTQERVVRVASPGKGIMFAVTVTDVDSEAAWCVEELDVKYTAIVEYS